MDSEARSATPPLSEELLGSARSGGEPTAAAEVAAILAPSLDAKSSSMPTQAPRDQTHRRAKERESVTHTHLHRGPMHHQTGCYLDMACPDFPPGHGIQHQLSHPQVWLPFAERSAARSPTCGRSTTPVQHWPAWPAATAATGTCRNRAWLTGASPATSPRWPSLRGERGSLKHGCPYV